MIKEYNLQVSETVLPIYINGQCPIIKTCSDITLNLSSKDSSNGNVIHKAGVKFPNFSQNAAKFPNFMGPDPIPKKRSESPALAKSM